MLPTLTEEQRDILGRPIQERKILDAIALMRSEKSPGPDSFPAKWYRAKHNLTTYLNKLLITALILRIDCQKHCPNPEKNKDPEDLASYRPVSLINVDVKMLAKALTFRFESMIAFLVKPDQTGLSREEIPSIISEDL